MSFAKALKAVLFSPPSLLFDWGDPEGHRTAGWFELLYDLSFVAAAIKCSEALKESVTWYGLGAFFVIFWQFWNAWLGMTLYTTRFHANDLAHQVYYLIAMMATVTMTVHVTTFEEGEMGSRVIPGFAVSAAVVHASLMSQYVIVASYLPRTRVVAYIFTAGEAMATLFLILAGVVVRWGDRPDGEHAALWLMTASSVCSSISSSASSLVPQRLPMHIEHISERYGLFVMLILGETVISLTLPELDRNRTHYGFVLMGIALVFGLMLLYFDGQPDDARFHALRRSRGAGRVFTHAHMVLSCSLLVGGAALKVSLEEGPETSNLSDGKRWFLGGSVFVSLVCVAIIRMAHTGLAWELGIGDTEGKPQPHTARIDGPHQPLPAVPPAEEGNVVEEREEKEQGVQVEEREEKEEAQRVQVEGQGVEVLEEANGVEKEEAQGGEEEEEEGQGATMTPAETPSDGEASEMAVTPSLADIEPKSTRNAPVPMSSGADRDVGAPASAVNAVTTMSITTTTTTTMPMMPTPPPPTTMPMMPPPPTTTTPAGAGGGFHSASGPGRRESGGGGGALASALPPHMRQIRIREGRSGSFKAPQELRHKTYALPTIAAQRSVSQSWLPHEQPRRKDSFVLWDSANAPVDDAGEAPSPVPWQLELGLDAGAEDVPSLRLRLHSHRHRHRTRSRADAAKMKTSPLHCAENGGWGKEDGEDVDEEDDGEEDGTATPSVQAESEAGADEADVRAASVRTVPEDAESERRSSRRAPREDPISRLLAEIGSTQAQGDDLNDDDAYGFDAQHEGEWARTLATFATPREGRSTSIRVLVRRKEAPPTKFFTASRVWRRLIWFTRAVLSFLPLVWAARVTGAIALEGLTLATVMVYVLVDQGEALLWDHDGGGENEESFPFGRSFAVRGHGNAGEEAGEGGGDHSGFAPTPEGGLPNMTSATKLG